jgi:hypothetical protein
VVTTALLNDDYFTKDINPPLYGQYPLGNQYEVTMRDVNEYGIPPRKAVPVMMNYLSYAEHDINETWRKKVFPYFYNLPYLYKQDWSDLYAQILNDYVNRNLNMSNEALKFLDYNYLFMRYGNYTVNMQYILPGGKQGTNKTYDFKNIIKFR